MSLILFLLSLFGGIGSGLLGVGGAVLLIPLLLAVPPLFGVGSLSMHQVSGITMIQVLAASATGYFFHRRGGFANGKAILAIGIPMGIFSFAGAAASKSMSSHTMLLIFGCMVTVAFFMLLTKSTGESDESSECNLKTIPAVCSGSCVGILSGIVGAGGGFILIPVMVKILKLPIRMAVGSSLGIVFIGALMGAVGKLMTFQVQWILLLPVVAGSLPSSLLGSYLSKKIAPSHIRHILLGLVLLILIKTGYDLYLIFILNR